MDNDTEIILTDISLVKLIPDLETFDKETRFDKIRLLFNYGFIFLPYEKKFVHPFDNASIKLKILYHTLPEIKNFLNTYSKTVYSLDQIEVLVDKKYNQYSLRRKLKYFLKTQSILWGTLTYVIGIILLVFLKSLPLLTAIIQIVGICFIHYWISHQVLFSRAKHISQSAPFFMKYSILFQIYRIVAILLTIYFMYKAFDGLTMWILFGLFLFLFLITNYFISVHIKEQWWAHDGLPTFKKYYKRN